MGFGWFSKGADSGDKALGKAQKLEKQERWAEALSFYDEVLAREPGSEPAAAGARTCRERLVAWNLEEAEAFREIDPPKAREHARLALDLAGPHGDLRERSSAALGALEAGAAPAKPSPRVDRQPMFAKSCACASPCSTPEEAHDGEDDIDVEDLAEFYLESCEPEVRTAFEDLQGAFRAGFVHLQRGELAEAEPRLEQAREENPGRPGPVYALGLLASVEGRLEEAAVCFEKALGLDGDFGPAARHLAETLREIGAHPKALEVLSQWLTHHPDDPEARLLLAVSRLEAGDAANALEDARLAQQQLHETDPRPGLLLAKAQRKTGDGQAALGTLQGLLARRPDSVEALVELAGLLLEQGGSAAERAAEAFKKCYRLDPEHGWWYLTKVAEAYHERGWAEEARDVLSRAREELPEEPAATTYWESVARRLTP